MPVWPLPATLQRAHDAPAAQEPLDLKPRVAAHITADAAEADEPVVSNGLSLCKLHHAAFDRPFLTVRPDSVIEVRRSILDEEDGPEPSQGWPR